MLPIALSVVGKEYVSSGSYLVWNTLEKVGDREDEEATFDCHFKLVGKGFVHLACCNFFLFLYFDFGSSNLPSLLCSIGTGEYVNK